MGQFFWTPKGVSILSCNRVPKIKDEDEGTRRRLVFLPLEVNLRLLPPDKQVPQGRMEKRIREEGPGILNWLIDGYREFMDRGIDQPQIMADLKEKLMSSADPVGVFMAEMTVKDDKGRLNVTQFYKAYEQWCERDGHSLYQSKTVREIMVEKGVEDLKSHGVKCWRGIDWHPDAAALLTAAGYPEVADRLEARPDAPAF